MRVYPTCLTIAGSDSSGGAGIQADLKTMAALGVYGTSAITAVTVQNTQGVKAIQGIEPAIVQGQIEAVQEDIGPEVWKLGMLYSPEIVRVIIEMIRKYRPKQVVFDPVMVATSGDRLMQEKTLAFIEELMTEVSVITPNTDEAEILARIPVAAEKDLWTAGQLLLEKGCPAVLMKGGHLKAGHTTDILFTKSDVPYLLKETYVDTPNTHGTGCTLSSALASCLALGYDLKEAAYRAKRFVTSALKAGAPVTTGKGHGPLNHFYAPVPLIPVNKNKNNTLTQT